MDGEIPIRQFQPLFPVLKANTTLHSLLEMAEAAELRVKRRMDLTLPFWIEAVDTMLSANLFEVLHGQGLVSHEQAVEISSERYEEFDAVRKKEEARLADEADLNELKRIEDEVKKQQGK